MNKLEIRADLQRLADGEIPQERRAQLLRALPANSEHWRELALAFVERQILDESLNGSERIDGTLDDSADESSKFQLGVRQVHRLSNGRSRPERSGRWSVRALWMMAVGASLLLGIALGNWRTFGDFNQLDSLALIPESPTNANPASEATATEQEHFGMPLAEALSRAAYPIPVDLRRELMKRGYLITELDQLSKVQLPTGQLVELPVRQVAVTYLGNATYQ
jgi:hypothetical protein